MSLKSELPSLEGRDLETYGFARVRDLAFDAIQVLWKKRQREGMSQKDLATKLGRDRAWVSKKLSGPGNWTFRSFGALVEALNGEAEIFVYPREEPDYPPSNFDAYIGYTDDQRSKRLNNLPSSNVGSNRLNLGKMEVEFNG